MDQLEFKSVAASVNPSDFKDPALTVKQNEQGELSISLEFSSCSAPTPVSQPYDVTAAGPSAHLTFHQGRVSRISANKAEIAAPEVHVVCRSLPAASPVSATFLLTDLSNSDGFPRAQCAFALGSFSCTLTPRTRSPLWATLEVTGATSDRIESLETEIERVIWLLAFANGASPTLPIIPRIEVRDGSGQLIEATLRHLPATPWKCRNAFLSQLKRIAGCGVQPPRTTAWPVVPIRIPSEVKSFVEWCHPRLVQSEGAYPLRRILHWLILATTPQPLQLRALVGAELLEMFRFSFAKNVFKAPQSGDRFRWPPGYPAAGSYMEFGQILRGLVWNIGNSHWRDEFVKFRNSIVHEGEILGSSFAEQISNTSDTIHFCHTIVLALLEWDKCGGSYYPYNVRPSTPKQFQR